MFYNQLINIQRKVRAFLSFPYNKNEILNKKDNLLIDELSLKAKKLVNNKRKNYKKTHKIFSEETLKIILDKQLVNFLQYSFIQKMFFVHNRLFLKTYLNEIKTNKQWKIWKTLLMENNIGNPVRYFLDPFTSGNKIFQIYHLKKYKDFTFFNLNKFDIIFEFGGGYGNMANTFKKINKKNKYIIFDTPEVCLLQYYYLRRNNINVSFNCNMKSQVILLSSIKNLKKILNGFRNKRKLFIANWSLSETPINFRKKFKFIFNNFDYQLISFQRNFENIDNFNYFKNINRDNLYKNRKSKIIPINKLKNNFYLFSKN
tara:strand:+ start:6642 stop:7586 length:945 start_codon:yes stop_codon:yes gene_type:complete